jgi:flagellar hook assembly protein FlgD
LSLSYLEMGIVHVGASEFMAALEAFISSTARSTSLLPDDGVLLTSSGADVQVTWTTRLLQSSPNPFRSRSVIRYELAAPGDVRIRIYDVRGRLLKRISAQHSQPGLFEVEWRGDTDEGRMAPPGVYFCQMATSGFLATRKMIRIE